MAKIQNFKFRQSLYNFGRDLPRNMHVFFFFLEWICYVISEEMSFEVISPMWSHANENEKKIVKSQKYKILKKKMVWRYGVKVPFHQIWQ